MPANWLAASSGYLESRRLGGNVSVRPARRGANRRGNPLSSEELAADEPYIHYSALTTTGQSAATLSSQSFTQSALSAAGSATAVLWNAEGGYLSAAGSATGTLTAVAKAAGAARALGASTAVMVGATA